MNYTEFQDLNYLPENILSIDSNIRKELLGACIDTINTAYLNKENFATSKFRTDLNDYVIIGFKGTSQLIDWQTDLNFNPKENLHNGFVKKANSINISHLLSNRNIILTGHSLGAAIAFFKFIEARNNPNTAKNIKMLVCLGMPRPGKETIVNQLLNDALNQEPKLSASTATHFIVLQDKGKTDPVTQLPKSYGSVSSDKVDTIDYSSTTPKGWSRFLELYLHQLNSYRDSLSTYLKSHQK